MVNGASAPSPAKWPRSVTGCATHTQKCPPWSRTRPASDTVPAMSSTTWSELYATATSKERSGEGECGAGREHVRARRCLPCRAARTSAWRGVDGRDLMPASRQVARRRALPAPDLDRSAAPVGEGRGRRRRPGSTSTRRAPVCEPIGSSSRPPVPTRLRCASRSTYSSGDSSRAGMTTTTKRAAARELGRGAGLWAMMTAVGSRDDVLGPSEGEEATC